MSPSAVRRRVTRRRYFPGGRSARLHAGAIERPTASSPEPVTRASSDRTGNRATCPASRSAAFSKTETASAPVGGAAAPGGRIERGARDADRHAAVERERREGDEEDSGDGAEKRAAHGDVLSRSMPPEASSAGIARPLRSDAMKTAFTEAAGVEVPLICGAMYPCSEPRARRRGLGGRGPRRRPAAFPRLRPRARVPGGAARDPVPHEKADRGERPDREVALLGLLSSGCRAGWTRRSRKACGSS